MFRIFRDPKRRNDRLRWRMPCTMLGLVFAILCLVSVSSGADLTRDILASSYQYTSELDPRQNGGAPLIITNQCSDSIYPGVLTQSGTGPGTGGFQLSTGSSRTLTVGKSWQGRVWGRTNCSFNSAGTAPGGNTQNGQACSTGDCGGIINCQGTGVTPVSLAEFTLDDGDGQTFYDISLVDGYNLPIAIVLHSDSNSTFDAIPPNLTNPSCVATAGDVQAPGWNPYTSGHGNFLGTNSSSPLPLEQQLSVSKVASWCPTNLEVSPLKGPNGGIYTYPDGNIQRPAFDPCYSACAKYGQPSDCCTGSYDSPSSCQPSSYSKAAKSVCPDAYSYAFDDQTSTFIIPSGAGFEVIFCPGGRSTNILATSKSQLTQLAQQGHVSKSRRDEEVNNFAQHASGALEDISMLSDQFGIGKGPVDSEGLGLLAPRSYSSCKGDGAVKSTKNSVKEGFSWRRDNGNALPGQYAAFDSHRCMSNRALYPMAANYSYNPPSAIQNGSWRRREDGKKARIAFIAMTAAAVLLA